MPKNIDAEINVVFLGTGSTDRNGLIGCRAYHGPNDKEPRPSNTIFFRIWQSLKDNKGSATLASWGVTENNKTLAPALYQRASVAVISYDITDKASFERAKEWVLEIRDAKSLRASSFTYDIQLFLVGLKTELEAQRQVNSKDVAEFAIQNEAVAMEASTETRKGVTELFETIADVGLAVEGKMEIKASAANQTLKLRTSKKKRYKVEKEREKDSMKTPYEIKAKVVFLGAESVGKTSLALRKYKGSFPENLQSTVGAAFIPQKMGDREHRFSLELWDVTGEEKQKKLAPLYYRGASVAVICYDTTNPQSFDQAIEWANELKFKQKDNAVGVSSNLQLMLVGLKTDLEAERKVQYEDVEAYAGMIGAEVMEASAKTNQNVDELYEKIGKAILKKLELDKAPAAPQPTAPVVQPPKEKTKVKGRRRKFTDSGEQEATAPIVSRQAERRPEKPALQADVAAAMEIANQAILKGIETAVMAAFQPLGNKTQEQQKNTRLEDFRTRVLPVLQTTLTLGQEKEWDDTLKVGEFQSYQQGAKREAVERRQIYLTIQPVLTFLPVLRDIVANKLSELGQVSDAERTTLIENLSQPVAALLRNEVKNTKSSVAKELEDITSRRSVSLDVLKVSVNDMVIEACLPKITGIEYEHAKRVLRVILSDGSNLNSPDKKEKKSLLKAYNRLSPLREHVVTIRSQVLEGVVQNPGVFEGASSQVVSQSNKVKAAITEVLDNTGLSKLFSEPKKIAKSDKIAVKDIHVDNVLKIIEEIQTGKRRVLLDTLAAGMDVTDPAFHRGLDNAIAGRPQEPAPGEKRRSWAEDETKKKDKPSLHDLW